MAVDEDGVVWEGVVAVDDEGEVDHCFVALVPGDLEGRCRVGVVDVVGVGFPAIHFGRRVLVWVSFAWLGASGFFTHYRSCSSMRYPLLLLRRRLWPLML